MQLCSSESAPGIFSQAEAFIEQYTQVPEGGFCWSLGVGSDQLTVRPWKSSRPNKDSVLGENPWSKDCRSYQGESSKILLGNMVVGAVLFGSVFGQQNGRVFGMVILGIRISHNKAPYQPTSILVVEFQRFTYFFPRHLSNEKTLVV